MTSYNERTNPRRRAGGKDFEMTINGVMDAVTRKPEALLLMGAGLALLMRNGRGLNLSSFGFASRSRDAGYEASTGSKHGASRASHGNSYPADAGYDGRSSQGIGSAARNAMRDVRDDASQMASEATDGMTRYASDMMRTVSDTASSYASSASEYVSSAGQWADDARTGLVDRSHRLAERARSLPEELDEAVQAHPLVLAALGVAIGAALGASLPSTSIENRTLGEASDQMWQSAEALTGRIGDAAEDAYDEAWRTAEEHGLSKDGLTSMAKDVGSKFASAAVGETPQQQASQGSSSHEVAKPAQPSQPHSQPAGVHVASTSHNPSGGSSPNKGGASSGAGESGSSQGGKRPGGQA